MNGSIAQSAFSRVGQLASLPAVHAAFRWFHLQETKIMQWQHDLVSIAAPPFGEQARAEWLAEAFRKLGLAQVEIDMEGNVLGWLEPVSADPRPCVLLSAHIDTVFPRDTPIHPVLDYRRLTAPGACDNGAGVAGMLAVAAALKSCGFSSPVDIVFAGNVGEEGDGNLRGVRCLYEMSPWKDRICAHIVLDGGGADTAVTQALGSRRYLITLRGPGGHSWTDAGTGNPIVVLSQAIASLAALPVSPRSSLSVGTIEGGSSVNSIPERAAARFDLRSLEAEELIAMEVALHRAIEDAVLAANRGRGESSRPGDIDFEIEQVGNRPAGMLPPGSPLFETLFMVDRHLGIRTQERTASTDANLPLSLGIPAVTIGAGGEGGGVHTRGEWYDATGRELALRRILLLVLAMAWNAAPEPSYETFGGYDRQGRERNMARNDLY
jgi:acetylornithine deacetylase/succinyl-diaminopimelate desuccinylase-like protein